MTQKQPIRTDVISVPVEQLKPAVSGRGLKVASPVPMPIKDGVIDAEPLGLLGNQFDLSSNIAQMVIHSRNTYAARAKGFDHEVQ